MSTPTYTYFEGRGRGEINRVLLTYAGVKFIDNRIPSITDEIRATHFGQLPIFKNGDFEIAQSTAIGQYIAKKHNLFGKTDEEGAEILSYVLSVVDLFEGLVASRSSDEAKGKLVSTLIPRHYGAWERQLKKSGSDYLFGSTITWADLAVFNTVDYMVNFLKLDSEIFKPYPHVIKLLNHISKAPQLVEYLKNRPVTKF